MCATVLNVSFVHLLTRSFVHVHLRRHWNANRKGYYIYIYIY
ncbi:hypothetical protein D915_001897, partial [Fasciola hepatica]